MDGCLIFLSISEIVSRFSKIVQENGYSCRRSRHILAFSAAFLDILRKSYQPLRENTTYSKQIRNSCQSLHDFLHNQTVRWNYFVFSFRLVFSSVFRSFSRHLVCVSKKVCKHFRVGAVWMDVTYVNLEKWRTYLFGCKDRRRYSRERVSQRLRKVGWEIELSYVQT